MGFFKIRAIFKIRGTFKYEGVLNARVFKYGDFLKNKRRAQGAFLGFTMERGHNLHNSWKIGGGNRIYDGDKTRANP